MGLDKFSGAQFSDFVILDTLYKNPGGNVYLGQFKYDKKLYVLKQRKFFDALGRRSAINEVNLLNQVDHKNVVKFFGHFWEDDRQSLFIVLEYCEGGDLGKLIDEHRHASPNLYYFQEVVIWKIFYQICCGVKHLHEIGIVHRDLKASNVLLCKDGVTVKIADLGVSKQLTDDVMMSTFHGTPLYLSPELLDGALYTEKTDIWSLGVLLYELSTLVPPFRGKSFADIAKAIKSGIYDELPPQYSSSIDRCIKWMLQSEFKKRPSISQLCTRVEQHVNHTFNESMWQISDSQNVIPQLPVVHIPVLDVPKVNKVQDVPKVSDTKESAQPPPSRGQGREPVHESESKNNVDKSNLHNMNHESMKLQEMSSKEKLDRVVSRRNILVNLEENHSESQHHHHHHHQQQQQSKEQVNKCVDEESDGVYVDVNRLLACHKKEQQLLVKLRKTKTLMDSSDYHHSDDVNHRNNNNINNSSVNVLEEKMKKCEEVIIQLEDGLKANGRISQELCSRLNLIPLNSEKDSCEVNKVSAMNVVNSPTRNANQRFISPIDKHASSAQGQGQNIPKVPVVQLKYRNDYDLEPKDNFQYGKKKHTVFVSASPVSPNQPVSSDDTRPSHQGHGLGQGYDQNVGMVQNQEKRPHTSQAIYRRQHDTQKVDVKQPVEHVHHQENLHHHNLHNDSTMLKSREEVKPVVKNNYRRVAALQKDQYDKRTSGKYNIISGNWEA